jgi:hypothetical protein
MFVYLRVSSNILRHVISIFLLIILAKTCASQDFAMNDSIKNLIVTQFVNTYLPHKNLLINVSANDITTWDIVGLPEYHGCATPIKFSQPLNKLLASYNLPDSFLLRQANNYIRSWDKNKVSFKIVRLLDRGRHPGRELDGIAKLFSANKKVYEISNPIILGSDIVAIKYGIVTRHNYFVSGPFLAIFKNSNGNLILLSEVR